METVRESWTDERLDDLKEGVSDLGRRVDAGFAEGRTELRHEAALIRREMKDEFRTVDARFDAMQASFDALQRTIIQIGGGMAAAFCAALIGLVATQL
jgi:hypothetical protein